jgi:hypothetical protein
MTNDNPKYRAWLTGLGWYMEFESEDFAELMQRVKTGGYDARIDYGTVPVATWGVLSGYRVLDSGYDYHGPTAYRDLAAAQSRAVQDMARDEKAREAAE